MNGMANEIVKGKKYYKESNYWCCQVNLNAGLKKISLIRIVIICRYGEYNPLALRNVRNCDEIEMFFCACCYRHSTLI